MHVTLFILEIPHCNLAQVKGKIVTMKMVLVKLSCIQHVWYNIFVISYNR